MSSRLTRTGLVRPGEARLREKVTTLPNRLSQARLTTPPPPPENALAAEPRELWVGMHLPWLSIEALEPISTEHPRAIVEMQGQTQYIAAVCERAYHRGIRVGMSMAAALALIPELAMAPRDLTREQRLLERLATRANRFTPRVSIVPPDGLLLEVKGSLHLFSGAEAFCYSLEFDCYEIGVRPSLSLAPAPLAALASARAGKLLRVTQPAYLIGEISSLPLLTLRWPADVIERLKQIGVYTIGQALRMPRGGFARRFGKAQLAELDRLTGRTTDLRTRFQVHERFRRKHDLLFELEHHEAILNTLEPVLEELGAFLKARQCGITRLDCLLTHRHAPATRCVLRLAAPAANAQHFKKLLGEQFATLSLPEPVRSCELRSGSLVSRAPAVESLWQPGEHGGGVSAAAPELIEHLRARLGHEAVYGLRVVESHRPETAWCAAELRAPLPAQSRTPLRSAMRTPPHALLPTSLHAPMSVQVPWAADRRPVWLLRQPEALAIRDGHPRRHGALKLLEGPERIETGWWSRDNVGDVTRDYYVALDAQGVRLWIFRERKASHGWFLQGVFG